jgi:hypothetical protein
MGRISRGGLDKAKEIGRDKKKIKLDEESFMD